MALHMTDKLKQLIALAKETNHSDQPSTLKKKSLIDSGVRGDAIKFLLNLKHGALTTIHLPLDGVDGSECTLNLRLLTAQERADIEEEMVKLCQDKKIMPLSYVYNLYYASKILSMASKKIPGQAVGNDVELTAEDLMNGMQDEFLLALAQRYDEFRLKNSPRLSNLTDEQINEVLKALDECEDDLGKMMSILDGLKWHWMQEMVVVMYQKHKELSQELNRLYTGQ